MNRVTLTLAAALAVTCAGPVHAFQTLPDGTTKQEREDTAKLNAEQLAKAKAETAAYEREVAATAQQAAAREGEIAAAQAEYARATAAYEAEKARVAALAAEQQQKWEADVAACKAGDRSRCAKPAPQN